ncbi:asparaginase [Luedemannella flava]|uniref:Asparaginase n=1 Tax=Luedemannella flava TaxID=349316 RepID=A0ABP4Y3N2_9ACTN
MAAPARVALFTLGGTIAMTPNPVGGITPTLSAADLTAAIPGLADADVALDLFDFRQKPGASLTFDDLRALAAAMQKQDDDGVAGIVVTQGTDTIEETSYTLDLLYTGHAPVVVTGAMRNPSLAGADGPANVLAAIQTAACGHLAGGGVVVAFSDEIHAARRVRKTHSTSTATFASPNGGPLGYLVEGHPHLINCVPGRTVVPGQTRPARVALVTLSLNDDGELLTGIADRFDGLVVAGFGVGHVPLDLVVPLAELAERIPTVLASRTGAGPVLAQTYGFPGSERDLLGRGLIRAGFLDPYKARVLLHATLAAGASRTEIVDAFAVAGGYADPTTTWPWPQNTTARPTEKEISHARR